ncbi:MAG: hypothetical protein HRU01_24005 [Myxococcales bacterium]|nr:hypothetical protein [Myxococcales bacterium]
MSLRIALIAAFSLFIGASAAEAASCMTFAKIKKYDADAKKIEIASAKGSERRYFPKPEGSTGSKLPRKCSRKLLKNPVYDVKPTGGRMSVTQIRMNFSGKMVNDTDDPAWLPAKLQELIDGKTTVVVLIRPGLGKDAPLGLTTIYLPITDEEKAEIQRLNDQAEDV